MKIEEVGLKDDNDKLRFELITVDSLKELAKVLTYGANKYKPNSWQNVEDGEDKHYASLLRHIFAWRNGESIDEESGLTHLGHAMANIMFLIYHDKNKKVKDDTNPRK